MARNIPWTDIYEIVKEAIDEYREEGSDTDPESPGVVTPVEWAEIGAHIILKGCELFGETVE